MKDTLKNLIKIKSIVTIALTILFFYLSAKGCITGDQVVVIFTTVIGFYFGTQARKGGSE